MAQENQVTKEKNQVTAKENQITTKNLRKVEQGKRLAEYNHRKREELKAQNSKQVESMLTSSQCYSIKAVIAVGVIGGLGYYIYQAKKGEVNAIPNNPPKQPSPRPQNSKSEMD